MPNNLEELERYHQEKLNGELPPPISLIEKPAPSLFCKRIYSLVEFTEKNLSAKRPFWWGNLWDERVIQIKILKHSIKNALMYPLPDDLGLFFDCHFINNHCSTSLFAPKKYNDFKEELNFILQEIKPSHLNRNTEANMNSIYNKLKKLQENDAERIINQAKLNYAQKLENSVPLALIEESIKKMSAQKHLENLIVEIKDELLMQESKKIAELNLRNTEMENIFSNLCNELSNIASSEMKKSQSIQKTKATSSQPTKDTATVKLISKFGMQADKKPLVVFDLQQGQEEYFQDVPITPNSSRNFDLN